MLDYGQRETRMINENKIILFKENARKPILDGMKMVYDAVRVTMGPAGRNVMIENEFMRPVATKDGVTVASFIKLSDKKQDMGAQLLKNVSRQTADTSGDGTTNSTVLSYTIVNNGIKLLEKNPNTNLIDFKRGMDYATELSLGYIKELSTVCKNKEDIMKIAMISSNGDKEISELVTNAVYTTKLENDQDGSVDIQTSTSFESSVEYSDAMVVGKGFGEFYQFVNTPESYTHQNDDFRVLVFDGSMGTVTPSIKRILSDCHQQDEALLIIANEFSNRFILNIVQNIRENNIKCLLIKSPEFGAYQKKVLHDVAVATLTNVVGGEGAGNAQLETLTREDLGVASNVLATSDKTYIKLGVSEEYVRKMNPKSSDEEISKLCEDVNANIRENIRKHSEGLTNMIKTLKNKHEKIQIENRIKNMSSIKATINIYGLTEVEVNEKKQRVEDAVFATTSAIEEGYVVGGGITLAKISRKLVEYFDSNEKEFEEYNDSFKLVYLNIIDSINAPMIQILNNAFKHPNNVYGYEEYDESFELVDVNLDWEGLSGYNVRTLKPVDNMIESGIIDPAKVIRCALQNANSISSIALTTEALIFSDGYYTEELSSKENHRLMYEGND